jgi:hypothetical protein
MTVDGEVSCRQTRLQREDVLLLLAWLQSEIRSESAAVRQIATGAWRSRHTSVTPDQAVRKIRHPCRKTPDSPARRPEEHRE